MGLTAYKFYHQPNSNQTVSAVKLGISRRHILGILVVARIFHMEPDDGLDEIDEERRFHICGITSAISKNLIADIQILPPD